MTSEAAFRVLSDIWRAREQTVADLDEPHGSGRSCQAMRHFGISEDPVDDDLRAAWWARLAREGKLRPGATSVGERLRTESP